MNLAILLFQTGKAAEAEAEFREALALQQKLADDNPAVIDCRNRVAQSHMNLGSLLSQTAKRGRRRPSSTRRSTSTANWPTTTPPSPTSATAWRSAT